MKFRWFRLVPLLLVGVGTVAHELSLTWQVEGDRLGLRAVTDDAPLAGGAVELRDAHGAVVARGTLDADGRFSWPLTPGAGDLTVVVGDGVGHHRRVTVPASALRPGGGSPGGPTPALHRQGHGDGTEPRVVRVVLGLTFLLAAGAAWTSYRNHRRLRELERRAPRP